MSVYMMLGFVPQPNLQLLHSFPPSLHLHSLILFHFIGDTNHGLGRTQCAPTYVSIFL